MMKKNCFIILITLFSYYLLCPSDFTSLCRKLEKEYTKFAVVVTNPQNGAVKKIYNPNMIHHDIYCPGSLLKPFALIAYSRSNKINPQETHNCTGYTEGHDSCWLREGHEKLSLLPALSHSCNFYFYHFLQKKLKKNDFLIMLDDFSLNPVKYDFDLSNEDFYQAAYGLNAKFLIKPIHILYAYNALFNEGRLWNADQELVNRIDLNQETIDLLRDGMKQAYLYGTAKNLFYSTKIPDIIVKTGTGASYTHGHYDWKNVMGWAVILYPSYAPEFSMLIVLKNNKSSVACDIAGEIINSLAKKK